MKVVFHSVNSALESSIVVPYAIFLTGKNTHVDSYLVDLASPCPFRTSLTTQRVQWESRERGISKRLSPLAHVCMEGAKHPTMIKILTPEREETPLVIMHTSQILYLYQPFISRRLALVS